MKKLLSLFVPLMALLLTLAPQTARADVDYSQQCLTITNSGSAATLYFSLPTHSTTVPVGVKLEYRDVTNDGTWKTLFDVDAMTVSASLKDGNNTSRTMGKICELYFSANQTYEFRSANWGTGFTEDRYIRIHAHLTNSTSSPYKFTVSGNIMSLVNNGVFNAEDDDEIPRAYCFKGLFSAETSGLNTQNCVWFDAANLILPAMTLTKGCYAKMFYNEDNSGISGMPNLPAETLAEACYEEMFAGINYLGYTGTGAKDASYSSKASELANILQTKIFNNAKTLAKACYAHMFDGSNNLFYKIGSQTIYLPCSTLAQECYSYMFYGNSGTNSINIEIKATSLYNCDGTEVKNAMSYMFAGSSSITTTNCTFKVHFPEWTATPSATTSPTYNWLYNRTRPTFYGPETLAKTANAHQAGGSSNYGTKSNLSTKYIVFDVKTNGGAWDNGCIADWSLAKNDIGTVAVPTPVKSGFGFVGWFTEPTGGTEWDGTASSVSVTTKYYAQYAELRTITFKDYDGTVKETKQVALGAMPTYTGPSLSREGKIFTSTWTPALTRVTGDAEYTAVYSDYFTITNRHATQKLTLSLSRGSSPPANITLKYRIVTNNLYGAWQTITTVNNTTSYTIADIPAGSSIQLYGDNSTYGFGQTGTYLYWTLSLSGSGEAVLSGELMSIFSGTETMVNNAATLPSRAFYGLFKSNDRIFSAADLKLSATNLGQECYLEMFISCSNLVDAPALPAAILAENCYQSMFNNCTSLTEAPELPATTLANYCYYSMFSYCTSLTTAPLLPVTTLTEGCYDAMFKGCTALVNVQPELPGTNLPKNCYYELFSGCTALTTAPEIMAGENATVGQAACYSMFTGCTSLTKAPSVLRPRTLSVNQVYYNMFLNCTSLQRGPDVWATSIPLVGSNQNNSLYGLYQNASNVSHIRVHFKAWGSMSFCNQWSVGLPTSGVFYCPPELERNFTNSSWNHIPYSPDYPWTVYSYDMTFIPVGANLIGEETHDSKRFTWETDVENVLDFMDAQKASPKMKGYYLDAACTQPVSEDDVKTMLTEQTMFQNGTTKNIYVKLSPYLIQFKNTDETVLQSTYYSIGETPSYVGEVPESPAGEDWYFTGWSPTISAISADQTYTAQYAPAADVTIMVEEPANGTLTVTTTGNTTLHAGTNTIKQGRTLVINATPADGWRIKNWTDIFPDENGRFRIEGTTARTIEVIFELRPDADIDCTSEFGTVTISDGETEVINRGTFTKGEVILTATPAYPSVLEFKHWSDDVNNTTNPRTFNLQANTVLYAVFDTKVPVVSGNEERTVTPQGIGAGTSIVYKMEPCTVKVGNTNYIYTPIDMGCGVAWADRNLGATTETATGTYYGWGDLTGKAKAKEAYDYYSDIAGLGDYGKLPSDADAARNTLGSNWKIPTKEQMQSLVDNTTVFYTSASPAYYTLTSTKNDGLIKLPVTGYGKSNTTNSSNTWLWTNESASTVQATITNTIPWKLYINGTSTSTSPTKSVSNSNTIYVNAGIPIRPVYDPDFNKIRLTINVGSIQYVYVCEAGQQVTITADGSAANYKFLRWKKNNEVISTNNVYIFREFEDATYTAEFEFNAEADVYQNASSDVKQIKYPLNATIAGGIAYAPIDLGYGVAWADKNVGAETPNKSGGYFAWGKTAASTSFSNNNGYDTYTTTNPPDPEDNLGSDIDAATQNMGDNWRMPTKGEWGDLLSAANKVDISAYTFTNKQDNTKSIFLPATGYYSSSSATNTNNRNYWSSTLKSRSTSSAYKSRGYPYFYENDAIKSTYYSYYGMPVRAIYDPGTQYTLTIKVGEVSHQYICVPNQTVTVTAHPSDGYEFDEWEEDGNMSATRTFTVTANATYTAKFKSAQVSSHTVTGTPNNSNYGSVSGSGSVNHGGSITLTASSEEHYHFVNWMENETELGTNATLTLENVTADHTSIIANFAIDQYTVTWKSEDGESTLETDANQNYGTATAFNGTAPTKASTAQYTYTFDGWATSANGNLAYANGSTPTVSGDVTYYAHFSVATRQYTVTWMNESGTGEALETDANQNYGTATAFNGTIPTKEATAQYTYTFDGWATEANGAKVYNINETPTVSGNTTYYAHFSAATNKYTILWKNEDGTTLETDENVAYGATPAYNGATPTKTADSEAAGYTYTFNTWSPAVAAVTGDATYTANFTPAKKRYILTWDENGGNPLSGEYTHGSVEWGAEITVPANPTREGFDFAGWDVTPASVMPAAATTYTAQWTEQSAYFNLVDTEGADYYTTTLGGLKGLTKNICYVRTMAAGQWHVVSLPFDFNLHENTGHAFYGHIYNLAGASYSGGSLNLNFDPVTFVMEANHPYIFYSDQKAENLKFDNVTIKELKPNYAYANLGGGNNIEFRNTTYRVLLNDLAPNKTLIEKKHIIYVYQNTLYYPNTNPIWMRAFRGYFYLDVPDEDIHYVQPRMRIVLGGQTATVIEGNAVNQDEPAKKYIENGILIIERDGVRYNAQGAIIK